MANIITFLVAFLFLITPALAQEVQNISLAPFPQHDGSFVIQVTWEPPADSALIDHYLMYRVQGIGEGIRTPQIIPPHLSALNIADVPSLELFGVSIQIVWKDGLTSHGAFASIGHDTLKISPSPLVASVTSPTPPVGLSRADLGMVLFVIIAGAVIGTFCVRLFSRA